MPQLELTDAERKSLEEIPHPSLGAGANLYGSTKLFPDYQAEDGESYLTLIHGIAHESSVAFVAMLQATRALRKGFESVAYFYGPGSMNCMDTRGFPLTGDSAFPGEMNLNAQIKTFISEGGKVYCCRFALQMLYGHGEHSLVPGIRPINPLDVLDLILLHRNDNAFMIHTWTV